MNWWPYLLLGNVYLLLFYGFYTLLLRRETFFGLNRMYLVGAVLLSFTIPLIQADWVRNLFITQKINQTIYQLDMVTVNAYVQPANTGISIGQVASFIYLAGAGILLLRFIVQLLKLRQAFARAANHGAFSFFSRIKIGPALEQNGVIMTHEKVHARQWHSADVLLMEVIAIMNWFNPVVYLYRKAVKHIHEFIADSAVISSGTERQAYALLLLSQTVNVPVNNLTNSFFNHSLLKQRIMMLHKNPSKRTAMLKYGLCAPLFALMIILSSATAKTTKLITNIKWDASILQLDAAGATNTADAGFLRGDTTAGPVFSEVEESANPIGGMDKFYRFLGRNIRYPAEARNKNVQGRVICTFIIEKDGTFSHIRVVRGIGSGADQEAVRVLSIAPKWAPARQNGRIVRQQYTLPISFGLNNKPKVKDTIKIVYIPLGQKAAGMPIDTLQLIDNSPDGKLKVRSDNYEYYINGVYVSKREVEKLNARDIVTIDQGKAKPGDPNRKDIVWIKTRRK